MSTGLAARTPQSAAESVTDVAFARSFARAHHDNLRYVTETGNWVKRCDNGMWEWLSDAAAVAVVLAWLDLQWEDHATKPAGEGRVRQLDALTSLGGATKLLGLTKSLDMEMSLADLDADPLLIGTADGTVLDLRQPEGIDRPARASDFVTRKVAAVYDAAAEAPQWEAFVKWITCGDDELATYLQLIAGAAFTGYAPHHLVSFCGRGRNGKGVFIETLLKLAGSYGHTLSSSFFKASSNVDQQRRNIELLGKRLVASAETPVGTRTDVEVLKNLTGGDTLNGRALYKEAKPFPATHLLLSSSNGRMNFGGDQTDALWMRVLEVPFNNQVRPEDADPDLPAKLSSEAPGILNWVLVGAQAYLRNGRRLKPAPAVVEASVRDWQQEEDWLGRFVSDELDLGADPQAFASSQDVYDRYRAWAHTQGLSHPVAQRTLTAALRDQQGFVAKNCGPKRRRAFAGVTLKPGTPAAARTNPFF